MAKERYRFLLIAVFISVLCNGQELKSSSYALRLIYGQNVSKDSILANVHFEGKPNLNIDLIRFDNVGTTFGGEGPLIISSKDPVKVDSLGLIPCKVREDTLRSLIAALKNLDTKTYSRVTSEYVFRLTFRSDGQIYQYFVGGANALSCFFKKMESRILATGDKELLKSFYRFLMPSRLLVRSASGPKWRYDCP